MFGKNPTRPATKDGRQLAVQEIMHTIQGEGPLAGWPCGFVRLAGCNLACAFCDTEFETGIKNLKTPEEIANEVVIATGGIDLVVISGGEPLRQPLEALLWALYKRGVKYIQIETAGTLWQPELESLIRSNKLMIVCSPKTPNVHSAIAHFTRHWKYIIKAGAGELSKDDGLPIRGTQAKNILDKQILYRPWDDSERVEPNDGATDTIWVSPCDAHEANQTAENIQEAARIAMRYRYRLSLQTHKYLGLP